MKLKHAVRFIAGGTPDTANAAFWADDGSGVPWVAIGDMSAGRTVTTTAKSLTAAGVADRRLAIGEPGTVLFAMYASVAAVATLEVSAVWNQALLGIVPQKGVADSRFVAYWLRHYARQAVVQANSATQANLNAAQVANFPFASASVESQIRIADFLDDRVAAIDRIIAARREQRVLIAAGAARASYDAIRGARVDGARRSSGLRWLGDVPASWPMLTVATEYAVDLGKMLDEKRQSGAHGMPYLRNTNVQWDRIDVSDLKSMDIAPSERPRYTVRAGDLLVCEGGQPGRAAIWDGRMTSLGYQKALHRARSRGRSEPRWLLECLRVAVHMNAFAAENGQTTIGHLTKEQLRAARFPFPAPEEQRELLRTLHEHATTRSGASTQLTRSIDLLTEYKSSLITAAVTGELDVTTAGSGVPA